MDFFELPLRGEPAKFSTGQKNQFEVVLALSQGADVCADAVNNAAAPNTQSR